MGIALELMNFVQKLLSLIVVIIIAQAVFSWLIAFNVVNTRNDFVRRVWQILDRITTPLYRPIRRLLPDFGGIDFSPLVVILVIWLIQALIAGQAIDMQRSIYTGQ